MWTFCKICVIIDNYSYRYIVIDNYLLRNNRQLPKYLGQLQSDSIKSILPYFSKKAEEELSSPCTSQHH